MRKFLSTLILIACFGVSMQSNAQCTDRPTVTDFAPKTGFIGSTVIITGSNFSANPSENQVFFGATPATIISSSFSSLEVTVPEGSTTALISVKNQCNLSAYSKTHFNGIFCPTPLDASTYQNVAQEIPSVGAYNMISQDMDNDGRPEVISALSGVTIAQNLSTPGNINFVPRNFTTVGYFNSIASADFDGDGLKDLVSNNVVVRNTSTGPGNINVVNAGNSRSVSSYQIGVGDFNNDGKIDIIGQNGAGVYVAFNTSTGPGNINFTGRQFIQNLSGGRCNGIQVADVDGDGKADFLASLQSNTAVSLRNTTPNGSLTATFEPAEYWGSNGSYPYRALIADFNKDGKIDFTSCNYNAPANVAIWTNTSMVGDISFAPTVNLPSPRNNYRIGVGDVDGDGYADVVTKSNGLNTFSVYRNTTAGIGGIPTFDPRIDYSSSSRAEVSGIVVGDFDGDYVPDIATSGTSSRTIRFHRNTSAQVDTDPPTAVCQDITVGLDPNGNATVKAEMIDDGSSDACGLDDLLINGLPEVIFTCNDIGPNTVTLTVTDLAGNSVTCSAVVTVAPAAIIVAGQTTVCEGDTVTMNANLGDSYQWFQEGVAIPGATSQTYEATETGDYTVEVINSGGCSGVSDPLTATVNLNPTVDITPANTANICPNAPATLTASQSSLYQWKLDGVDIPDATQQEYSTSTPGNYSVSVIDLFGCSAESNAVAVISETPEIFTLGNGNYIFDGDAFPNQDKARTFLIRNDGIADLEVSDVFIDGPDAIYFTLDGISTPLTIAPNVTVEFDVVFNASDLRDYGAFLRIESNDCDRPLETYSLNSRISCPEISVEVTPFGLDCFGYDYQLTIAPTGGEAPYTITVSEGTEDPGQDNVYLYSGFTTPTNTVTISVTDANGCEVAPFDYELTNPTLVTAGSVEVTDATCTSNNDASVTYIGISGGTPHVNDPEFPTGYSYELFGPDGISPSQGSPTFSDLLPGNYAINVNDASGCSGESWVDFVIGNGDDVAPEAVCQNITVPLDDSGFAQIFSNQIDNGSNDNCGNVETFFNGSANISQTFFNSNFDNTGHGQSFTALETGVLTEVRFYVNGDSSGRNIHFYNSGTGSGTAFDIGTPDYTESGVDLIDSAGGSIWTEIVLTKAFPVIAGQQYSFVIEGNTDIYYFSGFDVYPEGAFIFGNDLSSGCCEDGDIAFDLTISSSILDYSCFSVGDQEVTLLVVDTNGNTATCNATVTVEDLTPPVVSCPGNIFAESRADLCGASFVLTGLESSDNCSIASASIISNGSTIFEYVFVDTNIGGLDGPRPIIFGPDGNLYVSHLGSGPGFTDGGILRFDGTTGAFIDDFVAPGILQFPRGLAFGPDGHLYVASYSNATNEIVKFDGTTGAFISTLVPAGGALNRPSGLIFGPDDDLFVSSVGTGEVLRYDMDGTFEGVFASGLSFPVGLNFGPDGNLYVANLGTSEILRFDGNTGTLIDDFVSANSGDLLSPEALEFGSDGILYVTSFSNGKVLGYDATTGDFISEISSAGVALSAPEGLTFGPDGHLYVANSGFDQIVRYPLGELEFPVGVNEVTYSATDNSGLTSSCSFNVTVEDIIPPIVPVQDIVVELDEFGQATIVAEDLIRDYNWIGYINLFDNGGGFIQGSVEPLENIKSNRDDGTNTVTLQPNFTFFNDYPDAISQGNTYIEETTLVDKTFAFTGTVLSSTLDPVYEKYAWVRVFDQNFGFLFERQDPLVDGEPFAVVYNNDVPSTSGAVYVQYGFTINGPTADPADEAALGSVVVEVDTNLTDACGEQPPVVDITSFDCSAIGNNLVEITVTDNNGNSTTETATVIVVDKIAPVITCPENVSAEISADRCDADIEVPAPEIVDNCYDPNITGSALVFDGADDRIEGTNPNLPQGDSARTIEAWINPTSFDTQTIYSYGNFAGNERSGLLLVGGVLYYVGEGNDYQSGASFVPLNSWTHVAVTLSGTEVSFYVNGELREVGNIGVSNTTGSDWSISNTSNFTFPREVMNGSIDEVRIWNVVRDQSEIATTRNIKLAGNEPGLVAYYRFEDGTGSTTLTDVVDTDNSGVLINMDENAAWIESTIANNTISVTNDFNNTSDASGTYPVGVTTVNWTITDASGVIETCAQTVTVEDNIAPALSCVGDITLEANTENCGAIVDFSVLEASDSCGIINASLSSNGETIFDYVFVESGSGGLDQVRPMVFGPDGNLYVSNLTSIPNGDSILRFDGITGAFIDSFTVPGLLQFPRGLDFGPDGNLYVASRNSSEVQKFDGTTGALISTFVPAGGNLIRPTGLTFGPDGDLFVASSSTAEVQRYDGVTGAFEGVVASGLSFPIGIIFGPDENLYVANFSTNAILRFDGTTGTYLDDFVASGSGGLAGPEDLEFGPDGNLYVTSFVTGQVLVYDGDTGDFIRDVSASGITISNPDGMTFGPDDNLYVSDLGRDRIVRYPTGLEFPLGETDVTYEVADAQGNSVSCSFTITVEGGFSPELVSYTLIAEEEIHLHGNNTVSSGSVGLLDDDGEAKIHDETVVAGEVIAAEIDLDDDSSVGGQNMAPAVIDLPQFYYNTFSDGDSEDITVEEDETVVLDGDVYGKVEVKEGGTVIFTNPNVFLEELKTKDDGNVEFTGKTNLIVQAKVELDKNTTFNSAAFTVVIYAEDDVHVEEGSNVNANIYSKKLIDVKGKDDNPTTMSGLFIGEKIKGQDYVTWGPGESCLPAEVVEPELVADCECKGGMIEVTFEYAGDGNSLTTNSGIITDNGDGTYTVTDGGDKLDSNLEISDGTNIAEIHTSCSDDILGVTFAGDITVTAYMDNYGNIGSVEGCIPAPEPCECNGGIVSLTFSYDGTGELSTNSGTLFDNGDGTYTVTADADEKLEKDLEITDGTDTAEIHTSCSDDILGVTFAGGVTVTSHTDNYGNVCSVPSDDDGAKRVDSDPVAEEEDALSSGDIDIDSIVEFDVKAWPVPSKSHFNLKVMTMNTTDKVEISVVDISNKLIHVDDFIWNQSYQFGEKLPAGVYFVRIVQGANMKVIRVMKR